MVMVGVAAAERRRLHFEQDGMVEEDDANKAKARMELLMLMLLLSLVVAEQSQK